jgi:hypothetical protein
MRCLSALCLLALLFYSAQVRCAGLVRCGSLRNSSNRHTTPNCTHTRLRFVVLQAQDAAAEAAPR